MAARKSQRRPVSRRRDEQALRERIVQAAFGAFMEHGYTGTSTLAIATRAKVSKRELYALFASKEAMLAEGIRRRTEQMEVGHDLPEARDRRMVGDVLAHFGARLMQEVSNPHVTAVYRLAIAEQLRAPEIAQILDDAGRQASKRALAIFFTKAQSAALLAKGDPPAMAAQFLSLLWSDHFVPLLLGVETRPDEAECRHRARSAAAQFLTLNPAAVDQARP